MVAEFRDPDYVDKGSVDPEILVEIYANFGSYESSDQKPKEKKQNLEELFGNISSELLYLREHELVTVLADGEQLNVKLSYGEWELAEEIFERTCRSEKPSEIMEDMDLPHYLENPEDTAEEYFNPYVEGSHHPPVELLEEIIRNIPEGEEVSPDEVTEKTRILSHRGLRRWMNYLEGQEVLERTESGRFRIVDSADIDHILEEPEESLKNKERFGRNPWKP
ncbi:MAG: hypothetical protein ABEJ56_01245 [Candidatus Nanohaloarchaea archaeon]